MDSAEKRDMLVVVTSMHNKSVFINITVMGRQEDVYGPFEIVPEEEMKQIINCFKEDVINVEITPPSECNGLDECGITFTVKELL